MEALSSALSSLGKKLAWEQEEWLAHANLRRRHRENFVAEAARRAAAQQLGGRGRHGLKLGLKVALAAAFLLATPVVLWLSISSTPALTFSVGRSSDIASAGTWVSAPPAAKLPIRFSDGTKVVLRPSTRARVLELRSEGAHLVIENGSADVSVKPRKNAHWELNVGPFVVEVLGTQFDVSWNPESDRFKLHLRKGKIELSGCVFGAGRTVMAGEVVRASCKKRHFEITSSDDDRARRTGDAERAEEQRSDQQTEQGALDGSSTFQPSDREAQRDGTGRGKSPAEPSGADKSWQALARAGEYRQAYAQVQDSGFARAVGTANEKDLLLLGDVARFAGGTRDAIHAYKQLRARFAGTPEAATAAFSLARIHFDQRSNYALAARYFQSYLSDRPSGPLAREALGRLMECYQRAGNTKLARQTAERYLAAHPNGPHSQLARKLSSSQSSE